MCASPIEEIPNEYRRQCAEAVLRCYGTSAIFDRRAKRLRWCLRINAGLGIGVPALVGYILLNLASTPYILPVVVPIAVVLGITQFVMSILSLIWQWDDNFAYYLGSKIANARLAERFYKLSQATVLSLNEYIIQMRVIEAESDARGEQDQRFDISDKEKRRGMHAGLWKCKRACATCGITPTSLKPTTCGTCGNY